MTGLRNPTDGGRLQFQSIPEIKERFWATAGRLGRTFRFRKRKVKPSPLGNAVLLYFISLPQHAQEAIARAGLKRFEALLESDTPRDDVVASPLDVGDGLTPKTGKPLDGAVWDRVVDESGEGCGDDADARR